MYWSVLIILIINVGRLEILSSQIDSVLMENSGRGQGQNAACHGGKVRIQLRYNRNLGAWGGCDAFIISFAWTKQTRMSDNRINMVIYNLGRGIELFSNVPELMKGL
jgi:hypothetical protein